MHLHCYHIKGILKSREFISTEASVWSGERGNFTPLELLKPHQSMLDCCFLIYLCMSLSLHVSFRALVLLLKCYSLHTDGWLFPFYELQRSDYWEVFGLLTGDPGSLSVLQVVTSCYHQHFPCFLMDVTHKLHLYNDFTSGFLHSTDRVHEGFCGGFDMCSSPVWRIYVS